MTITIKNYLKKILPKSWILMSHKLRSYIACLLYGFPARKIKIIGVTGTNGKTTTCHLIKSILEEAGYSVGMATTINFQIKERKWINKTKMTTLSPFILQRFLSQMVRKKCDYAIIETTSHAVVQYRTWGIPYDIMVLTNVTHDHLDYHETFENYRLTKEALFRDLDKSFRKKNTLKASIVNRDDPNFSHFFDYEADLKLSYGIIGGDVTASNILYRFEGSDFIVKTPKGKFLVKLKLSGRFNISNALGAISAGVSQGIELNKIKKGIEKIKSVDGRMEKIDEGQNFLVIVDYAHTPDAFKKIYEALIPVKKGRIIHVFGACGDRDRSKRPIMGALAARRSNFIILTDEDPYSENPKKIIEEIEQGILEDKVRNKMILGKNYWKILDRKEAISKALSLAQKDDIVLITGKGAEQAMQVKDVKISWDDRKITQDILKERK